MPDREEVAARLAAAVLQTAPEPAGQRPGRSSDMIATCRHAVAVYETILGMLPVHQPGNSAGAEAPGRRAAPAQRAANGPAPTPARR
jgi:hypothetical protein